MGSNVVMYKVSEECETAFEHIGTIQLQSSEDYAERVPIQSMLYQSEQSLLFLDEAQDAVYRLDLATRQIVDRYEFGPKDKIDDITGLSKNAQMRDSPELLGVYGSCIYKLDPRVGKQNKVVGL